MIDLEKLKGVEITLKDGRKAKILNSMISNNTIKANVDYTDKVVSLRICLEKGIFTIDDQELVEEIKKSNAEIVENDKIEKQKKAEQAEIERQRKKEQEKEKKRVEKRQTDQENRKNGIYKANFCDGNFSGEYPNYKNWYKDKCSAECMKRNMDGKSGPNCKKISICNHFVKGLKTLEQVERTLNKDMCYESHIFTSYDVSAGWDVDKGIPNGWTLDEDRIIILTTVEPEKEEKDRIIFGAFLVDKVYQKDSIHPARATSYPNYRIELSYEEANELKYWEYSAPNNDGKIHWKENLLRYQTDEVCARILIDIISVMEKRHRSTNDIESAKNFLNEFLRIIGKEKDTIPAKNGALIKK